MINSVHGKKLFLVFYLVFFSFFSNLFLFTNHCDIANYAWDYRVYAYESTTYKVIEPLQQCSGDMFTWFENNRMKADPEKCHFLVSKRITSSIFASHNVKIDNNGFKIKSSLKQKLLGVIIDDRRTFKIHVGTCWKNPVKSSMQLQKLHSKRTRH